MGGDLLDSLPLNPLPRVLLLLHLERHRDEQLLQLLIAKVDAQLRMMADDGG